MATRNTIPLTLLAAITQTELADNPFALQAHKRMTSLCNSFSEQLFGDMCEQRMDYRGLGSVWTEVQKDLYDAIRHEWFRRKRPGRVNELLAAATEGLSQLDPRFGEMNLYVLLKHPGLIYIGLVQYYVKGYDEEKRMVTDYHQHFLVVGNALAA